MPQPPTAEQMAALFVFARQMSAHFGPSFAYDLGRSGLLRCRLPLARTRILSSNRDAKALPYARWMAKIELDDRKDLVPKNAANLPRAVFRLDHCPRDEPIEGFGYLSIQKEVRQRFPNRTPPGQV